MNELWNIPFLSKEDYEAHVSEFYNKITNAACMKSVGDFNRNVLDPIKMTFAYFISGMGVDSLVSEELSRQADKTINNSIGYFHQNIFKHIDNRVVPPTGFDNLCFTGRKELPEDFR